MTESVKCLVCQSKFSDVSQLREHFESHDLSKVRRFPCHLCDLKFIKFSTLVKHQLIVHLKKSYQGLKASQQLIDLRNEAEALSQDLPSVDPLDDLSEPSNNDGENSSENQPEPNVEDQKKEQKILNTHKCLVEGCEKTFNNATSLKMHGKCVHSDERSFTCDICSKSFKTSSNLNVHIKIHKNQRDHPCNMCSMSFFTSSHLKAHIGVHLNVTNYECSEPECGKTFIHLSSYKKHLNFHKGIKSHVCGICERSFSQLCHLREHLKIHTNERSHICPDCNKAFRRPDTLRIHRKRHES